MDAENPVGNSEADQSAEDDTTYRRRWKILAVLSLSLLIIMLNNASLNVALPELAKDVNADNTDLQWMVDAYALVFGGLLLVMGAVGDRFGRKGALQVGLIIVGSVAAWTALSAETANRAVAITTFQG